MAQILLRIEVNSDAETELLGDTTVDSVSKVNNVGIKPNTSGTYTSMPTEKSDGQAGLSFATGYLKFNSDNKLVNSDEIAGTLASEQSPTQLMWGATNSSGEYSVTLTFSDATNLDKIIIYGDKSANQFPIEAILDGTTTITSDDYIWAIPFSSASSTHTIQFIKWNRPNYNACLTYITVMLRYLDITKRQLNSLSSLSQSTANTKEIIYGALANSGSADITDTNGEIEDYIDAGIISNSKVPVEIYVNGNKIQSHIITNMDYKTNSKNFIIDINDRISALTNSIQFGYPVEIPVDQPEFNLINSLYDDLSDCLANTNLVSSIGYWENDLWHWSDEMLAVGAEYIIYGNNEYGTINEYLQSIKNTKIYAKEGSVLDRINKICEIAQLQFYINDEGRPRLTTARPIINSADLSNSIYIPKSKQFSELIIPKILKNKYNFVSINAINILTKTIIKSEIQANFNAYLLTSTGAMSSENPDSYNEFDIRIITKGSYSFFVGVIKPNYLNKNGLIGAKADSVNPLSPYRFKYEETSGPVLYEYENIDGFIASIGMLTSSFGYSSGGFLQKDFELYFSIPLNSSFENKTISFYLSAKSLYGYYTSNNILEFGEGNIKIDIGKDNEFLQTETSYDNSNMAELISTNILSDYANGVADGTITICCSDLYNIGGTKVKDWKNGEVLQVGDLIRFEQEPNRTFRITGRKFNYSGSPTLDLEFIEVKAVSVE